MGLFFMAPWLPEVEEWNELLGVLQDKHIKGYIVCGDQDEDCFECTQQFVQLLRDKNIEHKYKIIPNLNHDYPIHFEEVLKEAIEYIGMKTISSKKRRCIICDVSPFKI